MTLSPPFDGPRMELNDVFIVVDEQRTWVGNINNYSVLDMVAFLTGDERPQRGNPPLLEYELGAKRPGDFVVPTSVGPIISSRRVVDLLQSEKITGVEFYPVVLRGRKGEIHDDYFGWTVKGRAGPIDWAQYQVVVRKFPGGKFPYRKGFAVDMTRWDGSDVFMAEGNRVVTLVTRKLERLWSKAKLRDHSLESILEYVSGPVDGV